ncbi:hypothetical protein AAY473_029432 [Plecturocebus cupreus]
MEHRPLIPRFAKAKTSAPFAVTTLASLTHVVNPHGRPQLRAYLLSMEILRFQGLELQRAFEVSIAVVSSTGDSQQRSLTGCQRDSCGQCGGFASASEQRFLVQSKRN